MAQSMARFPAAWVVTHCAVGWAVKRGRSAPSLSFHAGQAVQTRRLTNSLISRTQAPGPAVDNTSYTYDAAGNLTSDTDQQSEAGTTVTDQQCSSYDTLDRLVAAWTATDNCAAAPAARTNLATTAGNYWQVCTAGGVTRVVWVSGGRWRVGRRRRCRRPGGGLPGAVPEFGSGARCGAASPLWPGLGGVPAGGRVSVSARDGAWSHRQSGPAQGLPGQALEQRRHKGAGVGLGSEQLSVQLSFQDGDQGGAGPGSRCPSRGRSPGAAAAVRARASCPGPRFQQHDRSSCRARRRRAAAPGRASALDVEGPPHLHGRGVRQGLRQTLMSRTGSLNRERPQMRVKTGNVERGSSSVRCSQNSPKERAGRANSPCAAAAVVSPWVAQPHHSWSSDQPAGPNSPRIPSRSAAKTHTAFAWRSPQSMAGVSG
ncbi:hypothetical protein GXW83_24000 [Streptacidiphilus sp. PB12-B1b]|nr:hypothetical protein GXW83_24000 [Streptacidiphilus sp. PB12-B1b]